jgi:GT2 family glycosyltransferase
VENAQGDGDFVSIVMVTYNSVSKLRTFFDKVINSLTNLNYNNYAVIIVDNNSQDDTISHCRKLMKSQNKHFIIKLRQNRGLPFAYNVGAVVAVKLFPQTKYFLFMNDDVVLSRDLIPILIEGLKGSCGAIQPIILHLDGHREVGFKIGITGYVRPIEYEEISGSAPLIRVPVIAGAALMIGRNVFFEVGMFDGDMFWGYDDVDFCWRLHKYGYTTCISTKAYVIHYGSATWGKENSIKYHYGVQNHIYMFYKNHSFASAIALTPLLLLEVLKVLCWRLGRRDLRGVKAILSGVINGLRRIPCALERGIFEPSRTPPRYLDPTVDLHLILGVSFHKRFKRG